MKSRIPYPGFIAKLLLLVYLFAFFKVLLPFVSYNIYYTYYSTVLCENKEKAELQCKGKCQLNKNLKKSAEEESKQFKIPKIQVEEIPSAIINYTKPQIFLLNEIFYSSYSEQYLSISPNHISPPPKA